MPSTDNPLLVDVVLQSTFRFLDTHSLRLARLVCRKWNDIGTTILLHRVFFQNFYEQVHADNFESLTDFVSSYSRNSFRNIHVRGLSILKMYKELNLIGPNVRKLKFYRTSFETEAESGRELYNLLGQLPNLQCLHMDLNETTAKMFSPTTMYGQELRKKFKFLSEIRLRSFDSINRRTLENLISIPWRLRTFEVTIDNRVPIELFQCFLTKHSATLEDLTISFSWSYEGYNYDVTYPNEDNWFIPLSLIHLKKLKIGADRGNDPQILCRSLITALQLPRLKTLKLFGECVEGSYGRMVSPKMWDLQTKSLTTLKIGSNFFDTSSFVRPIQVWPRVTEMTLYFPSIEIISSIFVSMDYLEKLNLELKNDKGIQWDSVLTGIKYSEEAANRSCLRQRPSTKASIRYFKSLKSLKIEFPEFAPEFYFSDFFIYNGLMFLKELQYLYIRGEKFTEEGLEDLRHELRPLAQINLVKYESLPYEFAYIEVKDY